VRDRARGEHEVRALGREVGGQQTADAATGAHHDVRPSLERSVHVVRRSWSRGRSAPRTCGTAIPGGRKAPHYSDARCTRPKRSVPVEFDFGSTKIFADGADREGILSYSADARIRGFTTNPTLMRAAGITDYETFARDVVEIVGSRPVSFEVFS